MPRKTPATQAADIEQVLPELRRRFGSTHIREPRADASWHVIDNITAERASRDFDTEEKANLLCATLNTENGAGGRYGVKPDGCEYAQIHGDAAIRVCTTHDPGFGLYGDEYCPRDERKTP